MSTTRIFTLSNAKVTLRNEGDSVRIEIMSFEDGAYKLKVKTHYFKDGSEDKTLLNLIRDKVKNNCPKVA